MTELRKLYVTNESDGTTMTVDTNGRGNVVQHSHLDSSYIHFDIDITGGTDVDLIAIDISDTTNYPHSNTNYIHIEHIGINIDSETNAEWIVQTGFLENVDATDGDFYEISHLQGNKSTGQNIDFHRNYAPNGPRCSSSYIATSDTSLNDTAFQTDVNLVSTLDPTTADTPSGNGDLVVRIDAGPGGANTNYTINMTIGYHTH